MRRASNVYLEMVFRDGIYHADPHPGNFLLPDGQHLAILDFGDVGRLTGPRKAQLEALLLAVGSRDVDELTDIVIDLTHAPADLDVDKLNGQIGTWLNRYLGGNIADLDMVGATNAGMQIMHSNRLTFPGDLALLFRVLVRLQGWAALSGRRFPSPSCSSRTCKRWPPNVSTHARSADGPSAACAAGNASSPTHQGRSGRCCSSSRTAPST